MATRVAAVGEVTGVEEMERRLDWLVEQVEREKEKTRDTFQQLHNLLAVREEGVLRELDGVVVEARQELKEKREVLQELQRAKESAERELTKKKLKRVLEKNLKTLEDEIKEELSKALSMTWVEVEWKREQLEQSLVDVCKVVKKKERPFRTEDYSLKLRPVWFHEGTGSSVFEDPQQLAINTVSGNIFVTDNNTNKVQVIDKTGHYLYHIPTPPHPVGLCLSDEFIFVTTGVKQLVKIQISNKKTVKSVVTEKMVYGMDISNNIYGCEYRNNSVIVFDKNLNFLKRIPLKSPHITSDTSIISIRLYENHMYVMFRRSDYRIQVFSQDGQLLRLVIPSSDINGSFFSLDRIGNIIVADYWANQIKIFSNSSHLIHTISNDNLTED
eukprot:TRINITY_DN1705_c0_g1_i3.p1 TRINITY_DN1705_c0_g1~~TRINITY_DN1705_c0_g1_i3.p1  ORF type:complete len:385 (-),score=103.08 TRINITY_DN1705_c0_g1_i3:14-1168(-)